MEGASETALAAQAAVPPYSLTGYFLGVALMFFLLAMLWLGARFLRQKGGLRFFGQTAALNVESRLALGPRKHLLVVKYRGRRLLLGVTEQNINLLAADPLGEEDFAPGDLMAGELAPGTPNGGPRPGHATTEAPGEHAGFGGKFKDLLHDFNKRK